MSTSLLGQSTTRLMLDVSCSNCCEGSFRYVCVAFRSDSAQCSAPQFCQTVKEMVIQMCKTFVLQAGLLNNLICNS